MGAFSTLFDGCSEPEIQSGIIRMKNHNFPLGQRTSTFCLLVHDFFLVM